MSDPRDCHGGECVDCGGWFRDDDDLDIASRCDDCADDLAKDIALERLAEARDTMQEANAARIDAHQAYEKALQHAHDVRADLPAGDWLAIAVDIVGVTR